MGPKLAPAIATCVAPGDTSKTELKGLCEASCEMECEGVHRADLSAKYVLNNCPLPSLS